MDQDEIITWKELDSAQKEVVNIFKTLKEGKHQINELQGEIDHARSSLLCDVLPVLEDGNYQNSFLNVYQNDLNYILNALSEAEGKFRRPLRIFNNFISSI